MSSYTRHIDYTVSGCNVKICSPFRFYINDDMRGEYIQVEIGFVSNGASIPFLIQKLFGWSPLDNRWLPAAIVHDALVGETAEKCYVKNDADGTVRYLDWDEATKWFDAALRVKQTQHNITDFRRKLFVIAVGLWGRVRG